MKNRPKIPQQIVDKLLVESRHVCNVCKKNVAQIHHIKKIDSSKGNEISNLIVLCIDCHRRAELSNSYFERKITSQQLKSYKDQWVELCKLPISFEKPVVTYCFINKPRVESLFNQVSEFREESELKELLSRTQNHEILAIRNRPLEKMMEVILNKLEFIDLEIVERADVLNKLEVLEGLQVFIAKNFYGKGLKSPAYYEKYDIHDITKLPYLYWKNKIYNKNLLIKIVYDPKYILTMTGYIELRGHHRLACFGTIKRVAKDNNRTIMEIMPLAIGLRQPSWVRTF